MLSCFIYRFQKVTIAKEADSITHTVFSVIPVSEPAPPQYPFSLTAACFPYSRTDPLNVVFLSSSLLVPAYALQLLEAA